MKITPECIPCLLTRLLFEIGLVDRTRAEKVMKEACRIISSEFSSEICSAELATHVHKRTYELLDNIDPYENIKKRAMKVGLQLEEKAKTLIVQSDDRLHAAIKCSIVGNILDFGIVGGVCSPDELISSFDKMYHEGLGYDDVDKIRPYLKKGSKILFFTDNCGEIVFDKLLCEELKMFEVDLALVVKGEPILSDATLTEAKQIKLDEVVDEIITSGEYAVGFNTRQLDPVLNQHLENFDLIISKGMANFEALSETNYRPVLYLLRTKCAPVANALGLPKNLNAAKLYK